MAAASRKLVVASSVLAATFDETRHRQDLAQRTEAALLDLICLADQLALGGEVSGATRSAVGGGFAADAGPTERFAELGIRLQRFVRR